MESEHESRPGAGTQILQDYGDFRFRVSGRDHAGPIIVTPSRVIEWHIAGGAGELSTDELAPVLEQAEDFDLLILGCGTQMRPPPARTRMALRQAGIGCEPMTTPAACRTYNAALVEGRRVAAALIPVP